jgi:hypothetical protein
MTGRERLVSGVLGAWMLLAGSWSLLVVLDLRPVECTVDASVLTGMLDRPSLAFSPQYYYDYQCTVFEMLPTWLVLIWVCIALPLGGIFLRNGVRGEARILEIQWP